MLQSCANPVVPSGGPKDNQAPVLQHINTTYDKQNIVMRFDFNEQVTLNQPEKNIILNPASHDIISSVTGQNSIILKIQRTNPINENTYIQLLSGWAQDLNEKNPADSLPFYFIIPRITEIDSSIISGTIQNTSQSILSHIKLYVLNSAIYDNKLEELYFTKPGKTGFFTIPKFTIHDTSRFIILNDVNANNIIDSGEYFNIYNHKLTDTNYHVLPYCSIIRQTNLKYDSDGPILRVSGLKGAKFVYNDITYFHPDTGYIYLPDSTVPREIEDEDNNRYPIQYSKSQLSTSIRGYEYSPEDSTLTLICNKPCTEKLYDSILIVLTDSSIQARHYDILKSNFIQIKNIAQKKVSIIFRDSTFLTHSSVPNKQIRLETEPYKLTYGTLNIHKEPKDKNQYIVYLKQKDIFYKYVIPASDSMITVSKPSGTYDLLIVNDLDRSTKFTRSSLSALTSEEPVSVLRNIIISNKLVNSIMLKPAELFTKQVNRP